MMGSCKGKVATDSRRIAVLAAEQALPSLFLVWLTRGIWRRVQKGAASASLLARAGPPGAFLAGVLFLWRPLRLLLRLLKGQGALAVDAPGRLPFLGHFLFMNGLRKARPGIWDAFVKLHTEVGSTVRLVIGPEIAPVKVFHFTDDASNVEHILKRNFENYGKGTEVGSVFSEFLGRGIFAVDGKLWREQRKTASGIFSRRNFGENMTHVFQAHARRLVSILRRRAEQQPGGEVEMQELLFSLTLDAFCEVGFGLPWDSIDDQDSDAPAGPLGPGKPVLREWAGHFDSAQQVIVNRFAYRPFWKLERMLGWLRLLPKGHDERQFVRSISFINRVVQEMLDQRFKKVGSTASADLLSLFMEVTRDRTYLRDVVMSFVLAGRDTTACTLTWLFWELSKSPQELARVRSEILQEASDAQVAWGSDFSFEQLNRLRYTTACVRETVRLHPAVPADPKVAFGDDVLPDGTLISRGDYVFFEPYIMARDPRHWGPHAAEWRPERWLQMEKEPSAFVNCAFQAGPRICLGRDMAVLEVRAVLAQVVLAGLHWEVRRGYSPTYRYPSLVLPMASPGLPAGVSLSPASSSAP